jgi:hypothetical protein
MGKRRPARRAAAVAAELAAIADIGIDGALPR